MKLYLVSVPRGVHEHAQHQHSVMMIEVGLLDRLMSRCMMYPQVNSTRRSWPPFATTQAQDGSTHPAKVYCF